MLAESTPGAVARIGNGCQRSSAWNADRRSLRTRRNTMSSRRSRQGQLPKQHDKDMTHLPTSNEDVLSFAQLSELKRVIAHRWDLLASQPPPQHSPTRTEPSRSSTHDSQASSICSTSTVGRRHWDCGNIGGLHWRNFRADHEARAETCHRALDAVLSLLACSMMLRA